MRAFYPVMQSGMHHKTSRVDAVLRSIQHVAFYIDLHQVAGGHFAVMQTKRVDQELLIVSACRDWYTHGDVVVNHFGPTEHGKNAVASGELYACSPFIRMAVCRHKPQTNLNCKQPKGP